MDSVSTLAMYLIEVGKVVVLCSHIADALNSFEFAIKHIQTIASDTHASSSVSDVTVKRTKYITCMVSSHVRR